jgi:hypothetical protein
MGPDDGEDAFRVLLVAVEECVRCLEQRVEGNKKLTRGDFTTEVPPQHFNRVEPGAVGRQVQPHQPPCRGADHGLDCIIGLGIRVIPSHIDGASWMLVDEGLQTARRPPGDICGVGTTPRFRPYDS